MSIIRVSKHTKYTVVSNTPINDPKIDYDTLGLLVYLLSKPDGWNVSIRHLVKQKKSGETKIKRMLKELQNNGYAEWVRFNTGRVEWTIFEVPQNDKKQCANDHISPQGQNPQEENPQEENPHVENNLDIVSTQPLVNTDSKVNTDSEQSASFDAWYEIYPLKKSKKKARDIWIKRNLHEQSDMLMERLKEQVKSCWSMNNPDKTKIKHPSTYLNGECWDDEITPMTGANNGNNRNKKETPGERKNRLLGELRQEQGYG